MGQTLIEHNLPLVDYHVNLIARRMPRHICREDMRQAGCMGLMKAAERFRVDGGAAFTTFASLPVRGAILDQFRREAWRADGKRQTGPRVEVRGFPEPFYWPKPVEEFKAWVFVGLSRGQRLLMALRYLEDFTWPEIGRVLGVTYARVSQMHKEILIQIRERVSKKQRQMDSNHRTLPVAPLQRGVEGCCCNHV